MDQQQESLYTWANGTTHNTSGTNLRRIKFPKSHIRIAFKVEREASQCSLSTKILDTAPFRRPLRRRSTGSLSSWTLTRFSSELQEIVLLFFPQNEKSWGVVGNKKPPFVFFASPLGFGFIRNGYTCWSFPEAGYCGFGCWPSAVTQAACSPTLYSALYSRQEGLLAFGKRTLLPDPNEKSRLLSNAQAFRQ